jgi:hypothetical protein
VIDLFGTCVALNLLVVNLMKTCDAAADLSRVAPSTVHDE